MTSPDPNQPFDPNQPPAPGYGQQPGYQQPGYQQPGYPQQPGQPYPYAAAPAQPMSPADEKLWATLIHIGGFLISFLVPLIGYLVLKDRGPFVKAHAATALNFQLTILIAYIVGGILTVAFIGILIVTAAWIVSLVFSIIAAVKANKGEWYTYPMSIPFVK